MNYQVLVCEDDRETHAWLADRLKGWGLSVISAFTGLEAVSLACCAPPDLILLDMVLPDVDSMAVIRKFSIESKTAAIPIIALAPTEWIAERLSKVPIAGVIQKPVNEQILENAVRGILPNLNRTNSRLPGAVKEMLSRETETSGAANPKRVLLVEDAMLAAKMMGTLLEHAGYRVTHAANAETALQLLRQQQPEFMLLDVILPGMDGVEFVHQIQQSDLHIPFVVVTGIHDPRRMSALQSMGALRVFEKPIHSDELLGFMDNYFSRGEQPAIR